MDLLMRLNQHFRSFNNPFANFSTTTWLKKLKGVLKATIKQAFPQYPFKISGHIIDSVTKKVFFIIKAPYISTPIYLTASELLNDEKYIVGLSNGDKKKISEQYRKEILSPKAHIIEFPITDDENDVFKIFLAEENKIVCLTTKAIFEENKHILTILGIEDVIRITIRYSEQKYLLSPTPKSIESLNNKFSITNQNE